jgi:hypothetical protein
MDLLVALIILSDLGIYLEKDRVYTMLIPYQTKLNGLNYWFIKRSQVLLVSNRWQQ